MDYGDIGNAVIQATTNTVAINSEVRHVIK